MTLQVALPRGVAVKVITKTESLEEDTCRNNNVYQYKVD
jgi:hypothetical protein